MIPLRWPNRKQRLNVLAALMCGVAMSGAAANAHAELSHALVNALDKRQWSVALQEVGNDAQLRSVIQWYYLRDEDVDTNYPQLTSFIEKHPNWPGQNLLRIKAEKILFKTKSGQAREWLAKYPPISGYGKLAKARHDKENREALVKEAWKQGDFDQADISVITNEFGELLTQEDHRARIERLLSEEKATIASNYTKYVSDDYRALYTARIALIREDGDEESKISKVPSKLADDPGLLIDRIIWRNKRGLIGGVIELLKEMDADNPYAGEVWKIRAGQVRESIESGDYPGALSLLVNAGNKLEGSERADAFWLTGWLQMDFLKNPNEAYKAFYQMFKAVTYPVSKSRAAYWAARAADANGNADIAQSWYSVAAQFPSTFYGQLAIDKTNPGQPLVIAQVKPDEDLVQQYMKSDLLKIIKQLISVGQVHLADPFIAYVNEEADTPEKLSALAEAFGEMGMHFGSVRTAKTAVKMNLILSRRGWPMTRVDESFGLEAALPHAIARQESEFNAKAESVAGARGLMQLMPTTAHKLADRMGMNFSQNRLFDPEYNVTLGSAYLQELLVKFDGSYLLTAAAYNAGPGRINQWIKRFGRPGQSVEQTVSWIEMIPYSETRNYVQRVLENVQVYRTLMHADAPLGIRKDLLR